MLDLVKSYVKSECASPPNEKPQLQFRFTPPKSPIQSSFHHIMLWPPQYNANRFVVYIYIVFAVLLSPSVFLATYHFSKMLSLDINIQYMKSAAGSMNCCCCLLLDADGFAVSMLPLLAYRI